MPIINGIIDFYAEVVQLTDPFLYDTLTEPDLTINQTFEIATDSDNLRQVLQFEIPVNKINPQVGGAYVVVSRDARIANPTDTLGANIVLAGSTGDGRRWTV